jgi:hypothetical protein
VVSRKMLFVVSESNEAIVVVKTGFMDAPEGPLSRFLEAAAYTGAAGNGDLGVV